MQNNIFFSFFLFDSSPIKYSKFWSNLHQNACSVKILYLLYSSSTSAFTFRQKTKNKYTHKHTTSLSNVLLSKSVIKNFCAKIQIWWLHATKSAVLNQKNLNDSINTIFFFFFFFYFIWVWVLQLSQHC